MLKKAVLDMEISNKNRYHLSDYKRGDIFPIVSDVMFHTMLNNSTRKIYISYFLAVLLDKDFDQIVKNSLKQLYLYLL